MAQGNLNTVAHHEGAYDGSAQPTHPVLTIKTEQMLQTGCGGVTWSQSTSLAALHVKPLTSPTAVWKVWLTSDCGPPREVHQTTSSRVVMLLSSKHFCGFLENTAFVR